eukprot:TRINITY_DN1129_c0_g1_i7.p1 TRINITY_DN1129_c0_g1~~TRINITY_DN1129_c0_g1_i7.p1  ORF type:complete len:165 (+),score=2.44 TRINITY_DN1129_c0_g1_i7:75-569(+)
MCIRDRFKVYQRKYLSIMPKAFPLSDSKSNKDIGHKFFVLHEGSQPVKENDNGVLFKIGYFNGDMKNGVERAMPVGFQGNVIIDMYVKIDKDKDLANLVYKSLEFYREATHRRRNWFRTSLKIIRHVVGNILDNCEAHNLGSKFEWVEKPIPITCKNRFESQDQ